MYSAQRASALSCRVIMHADLDCFYAQCEEKFNPSIRGKPVVVCAYSQRTPDSGAVSTCNYEARKYGVRAGATITQAKKLLENIEAYFLPMNRPLYEEVAGRIMETLIKNAVPYERVGIDEAYLDVSAKTGGNFDRAKELAQEIRQSIVQRDGITCSVGIAANKLLAKIASDHKKPNGLTVIRPEETGLFLAGLPVGRIPGVGKKIEEKLTRLKIATVSELSALSPAMLVEEFGRNLGGYLFQAARGEDDDPVENKEQPAQFSRIGTLKQNTRETREILPLLVELSNSASKKLAHAGLACKSVSVIAILDNLSIHTKSTTLGSPTSDADVIAERSSDLVRLFLESTPTAIIRRIGVKLAVLSRPVRQTDLSRFLQS